MKIKFILTFHNKFCINFSSKFYSNLFTLVRCIIYIFSQGSVLFYRGFTYINIAIAQTKCVYR